MTQYDGAGERRLFDERLYNGKMLGLAPRTWPLTPGIKRIAISSRHLTDRHAKALFAPASSGGRPLEQSSASPADAHQDRPAGAVRGSARPWPGGRRGWGRGAAPRAPRHDA